MDDSISPVTGGQAVPPTTKHRALGSSLLSWHLHHTGIEDAEPSRAPMTAKHKGQVLGVSHFCVQYNVFAYIMILIYDFPWVSYHN